MSKKKGIRKEKKKGLTDAELIDKYGDLEPLIPVEKMITVMLSSQIRTLHQSWRSVTKITLE